MISALQFITLLCLLFGFYVLRLNYKSALYRIFFILCAAVVVSAFAFNMMNSTDDKPTLLFWNTVETIAAIICWAINLHFYIVLTKRRFSSFQVCLIYIPALINIIMYFVAGPIMLDFIRINGTWKFIPSRNITDVFFIVYSFSYAVIDMAMVYDWGKKSALTKVKLQARTILSITIPLWIVSIAADFVLSTFDFYAFPCFGPIGRLIYIWGLWYALVKYRFLVPKKSFAAEDIINNMHDPVIVLNPVLKIMNANEPFLGMFAGSKHKHFRHLHDITGVNRELLDQLKKMKNGETDRFKCRLIYRHGQECVETESHFSRITDSFGDMTGIMIVSKENKEVSHFIKTFRITERQMEIIRLSLAGLSNVDISEKLKISKKTTETHLFNIYNRLGINNRIELYNLSREYNIIP